MNEGFRELMWTCLLCSKKILGGKFMRKKIVVATLVSAVLFGIGNTEQSMVPSVAYASEENTSVAEGLIVDGVFVQYQNQQAVVSDDAITISYTVPSEVTKIGDFAFSGNAGLDRVEFPEGLKEIGNLAFASCSSLSEVKLPKTLTTMGMQVFYGCEKLGKIEIPETVTSIGSDAFPPGCVIIVTAGSYAEEYAKVNQYTYQYTTGEEFVGDPNAGAVEEEITPTVTSDPAQTTEPETTAAPNDVNVSTPSAIDTNKTSMERAIIKKAKKSGKKAINVTIKKVKEADGYQLVYSTKKSFKGSKKVTFTGTKKTIKNLKKGKTYYIKVRAYKIGKDEKKVYGKYSNIKKVLLK